MNQFGSVQKLVEKALAFVHAALDETTPERAVGAKMYASEVLLHVGKLKPGAVTLAEAHRLAGMVAQLRAVLTVLGRKLELATPHQAN
jgi:hypothetical protein